MAVHSRDELGRILFQYDLDPLKLTDAGNITKVETAVGTFALKRKKLSDQQIEHVHRIYPLIRNLVIDGVCPLPSKYGDLVIRGSLNSCYLMPWFEETVPESALAERYQHLFVRAGQLHRQTMTDQKNATALCDSVLRMLAERSQSWAYFFDTAEHHVYPSPFEQMVLSQSARVIRNDQQAMAYFSRGAAAMQGEDGIKLRRALCHGRLSPLHLLIENEKSVLTNFEDSREDFSILETAALMEQAAVMLDPSPALWQTMLQSWFSVYRPSEEEAAFLYHIIICPQAPYDLIHAWHREKKPDESEYTKRMVRLIHAHERLVNALGNTIRKMRKKKQAAETKE